MTNQAVKVRRETLAACMTCPLCNKLLREATTISECLHTFCRKCIHEKIDEDEIENCPVCEIDLGGAPLEKLRPDHSLQDLREKIFPSKRRKVKEPEVVASVAVPARRKERSILSLVVSTPRVSVPAGSTGRRTKGVAGNEPSFRSSGSLADRMVKKEEDSGDDLPETPSSPENKSTHNKRQVKKASSSAEPNQSVRVKEAEEGPEPWDTKLDLWKPLNFLVEVANQTKSLKISQGSEYESQAGKSRMKEHKSKSKLDEEEGNYANSKTSETDTPKRLRRTQRKRSAGLNDSGASRSAKWERRSGQVWFSLVASNDQEGETALPQIPPNYIRIKDGNNITVSFIHKYLMTKLDLNSEAEIEIRCMGQPVVPTLQLHSLINQWLQTASKHQLVTASIGSSAKDFVIVLAYARKPPHPDSR